MVFPNRLVLHVVLVVLDDLLDGGTQILAVHHPQSVALAQADGAELCLAKRGVLDEEEGVRPTLDVYARRQPESELT